MHVTVVVSTLDRAESLEATLDALAAQTHVELDVVVVEGPSTDGTAELLDRWDGRLRRVPAPGRNLSAARNVGVEHAAGELVAFVDDDAVPLPRWIEELQEPFGDPAVVGTGGLVLGPDGREPQYRYSLADRTGRTSHPSTPPTSDATAPGADPFVYLQGTNMCFRRDALVAVGGFDEEIEYAYDEVDLCARLVDAGGRLVPLAGAPVIHGVLRSGVRDEDQELTDLYPLVKNRIYFGLRHRHAGAGRSVGAVARAVDDLVSDLLQYHERRRIAGLLTAAEHRRLVTGVERGWEDGMAAGLRERARTRALAAPPEKPGPRPGATPSPDALRIVLVDPTEVGAPETARDTAARASALSAAGHEVHVVAEPLGSDPRPSLGRRDGAWVHALDAGPALGPLAGREAADLVRAAFAVARTVAEIEERFGAVSVVAAPSRSAQGLVLAHLDGPPVLAVVEPRADPAGDHDSAGSRDRQELVDATLRAGDGVLDADERSSGGADDATAALCRAASDGPRRATEDRGRSRLIEALRRALGISLPDAAEAVRDGLDGEPGIPTAVRRAWRDPEALVAATFRALLGRRPAPEEVDGWATKLRGGAPPAAVVLEVAASSEARCHGARPAWLGALDTMPEWSLPACMQQAFSRDDDAQWSAEIADLWLGAGPGPGPRAALRDELLAGLALHDRDRRAALDASTRAAVDGRTIGAWARAAMPSPPADAPAVVERGRNRRSRARTALAAAPTLVRRVEGISAAVARLESRAADGRGLAAAVARIDAEVRVLPRLRDAIDDLGRRLHEAGRRDAGVRAERLAADRALLHELHAVRAQLEELRADLSLLRREHAVPSDQVRASASGRTVSSSSATPADRPTPSLRDG